MRTYGQYCALARSLDVIGDRWTLLIIRELLSRDSRYSDLRDGLPGIATNLLADRLRHLEHYGVIETYHAARPVNTAMYRLAPRGRDLAPVLVALVEWGLPLVATGQGADAFRSHWLVLAIRAIYRDIDVSDLGPLTVVIDTGDDPAILRIDDDGLHIDTSALPDADADANAAADHVSVAGDPEHVTAFFSTGSSARQLRITGHRDAQRRLHKLTARARRDSNRRDVSSEGGSTN